MEIIVCPMCKGQLELEVVEEKDGEIITGTLFCRKCNHAYPVEDAIPNLLPPELES